MFGLKLWKPSDPHDRCVAEWMGRLSKFSWGGIGVFKSDPEREALEALVNAGWAEWECETKVFGAAPLFINIRATLRTSGNVTQDEIVRHVQSLGFAGGEISTTPPRVAILTDLAEQGFQPDGIYERLRRHQAKGRFEFRITHREQPSINIALANATMGDIINQIHTPPEITKGQAQEQPRTPDATPVQTTEDPEAAGDLWLSASDMATRFDVDPGKLRGRLDTFRQSSDAGYREVQNRTPNEPKYLYNPAAVKHIIDDLRQPATKPQRKKD